MTLLELTPVLAFEQKEDHVAIHTGGRTHILSFNDAMIVKGMIEEAYSEMMEDTEASLRAALSWLKGELRYMQYYEPSDPAEVEGIKSRIEAVEQKLITISNRKKPH